MQKLKDSGYTTVESVAYTPSKVLEQVKGLSEEKIKKVLEAAFKIVDMGFTTVSTR